MNRLLAMLGLLALLLLAPARAELPQYVLRDLGTFGGQWAVINGINKHGHIVGYMGTAGEIKAFLWDGQFHDLGPGIAYAVNDAGAVVGSDGAGRGFIWEGQRREVLVGQLRDINEQATAVGWKVSPTHAFQMDGVSFTDLHIPGGQASYAYAINEAGWVAITCEFGYVYNVYKRAYLWDGATTRDLGTFGGENAGVSDINDSGQVVGWAETTSDGDAGFIWDGSLHNVGLGLRPSAINEQGWVVGSVGQGAFVWEDGIIQPLPTLGAQARASDINDAGAIAGYAVLQGVTHAVMWVPVPEPTTFVALAMCLAGLARARTRHGGGGRLARHDGGRELNRDG